MKRTDTRANVGAKSVRSVVQLRGKPCSLKRHFKGCLRQVVGYLDMLAARDPDRFVWSSAENIQRHARKWKGGGAYSRSQVFFWLHEAEQLGLLRPTVRTRHGIRRKGFVVTSHDALIPGAVPDHSVCVLEFKPDSEVSQTGLESSQTGLEDSQSGLQIGLNSLSDRTASRTSDRTEKSQQVPEKEPNGPDTIEVLGEDSDEVRRVLALVTQSSQPCKESPEKTEPLFSKKNYLEEQGRENEIEEESAKGKTATPPPTSSFKADLTKTQTRGQGKSDKTIGNLVRIENAVGASIIEAITDGEFHTEALPNYGPTDDLVQCCIEAHDEMASQPYLGRKSFADVMGRAMEILRAKYGEDAPPGWLPVMKKLRASKAKSRYEDAILLPEVEPSTVLVNPGSSIHAVSYEDADALESERQNNPALSVVLIDAAGRVGVPGCWTDGLKYADAVIAELQRKGQPIPKPLASIQNKLRDRVSEVVTSLISKSKQDADVAT